MPRPHRPKEETFGRPFRRGQETRAEQGQHAKKEAAEAAWQERERLMLAKERAERAERKKRRLDREAAQQGHGSSNQ